MINENDVSNIKVVEQNVLEAEFSDASVILCWFMDPEILEKMMVKFKNLKKEWLPPTPNSQEETT